ncbi:mannose-P-dolichol utilization defect 1 protein homolog [Amphiura filiformis]|uniref:mannose-P-dolichol utilization defect 1 protein homolog n=1 Tax=Amphiura filiformis TaxID=82378 RepID=UPI003B21CF27
MTPFLLDVVNWFCILPCIFLKVPQIYKIYSNKNTKGVSLRGYLISCSKHTFTIVYHARHSYPLLFYLEYPFLAVQDLVLIPLILFYDRRLNITMATTSIIMYLFYIAILMLLPMRIILILQVLQIPLGMYGKWSHLSVLSLTKM